MNLLKKIFTKKVKLFTKSIIINELNLIYYHLTNEFIPFEIFTTYFFFHLITSIEEKYRFMSMLKNIY